MRLLRFTMMIAVCLLIGMTSIRAQVFEHPGVFNREEDFARMRQKIAEKAEPWYTTWNNLLASPEASLGWNPRAVATVIRGGTGDNISLMYRDVASAYQHALIYKISGDKAHGDKAAQILNAWASINTLLSGNADRYLASGLDGYQFANAAEMMRGYPGFDIEKFKKYMLNVFFYPMNERFLIGNAWGAPHNDACSTNYRVNWDAANMSAMLAISILCDHKTGFDEGISYCKSGDGTGQIGRAVPFLHPDYPTSGANMVGQWEESGRDQGHAVGGMGLYGLFCEIAWNQGVDIYGYDDSRFRKGAEYVSRYNLGDSVAGSWKYNDLPYTTYSRKMGSNCTWYTESSLGAATRGKLGSCWEMIYNHYARRMNQGDKVQGLKQILQQQQWWSRSWPTLNMHADTYDTPGGGGLTFATDSGSYILPWRYMDINARSIAKLANYGKTTLKDSTLTVIGSGAGVKGTLDYCRYAFQKLVDDGVVVAQLNSLDEVNALCQAGVMMRESLEQNSANVFLSMSAAQGAVLSSRDSTGLTTNNITSNASMNSFPCWLQLSRSGNTFTASVSSDKINWTEIGRRNIKMKRLVYAGLAVSSNNVNAICTAVFDKAKIIQGNKRPIVKLTSPVSGAAYVTPANVTIKGEAYDLDGALDRADIYVNGNLVSTAKVSPYTYTLSGVTDGDYKVSVTAYDSQGASQSDSISFTVTPVTSKLPWYKFDETTPGYFAKDAGGGNLNAILYNGAVPAIGKINNSIRLNGVNQYVKIPNGVPERLSEFTIATWVNMDTLVTWSRVFDFGSGTSTNMFLAAANNNGKMAFTIAGGDGVSQSVETTTALPVKTWSFVAVSLGANRLSIYLNGLPVGTSMSFLPRPYDLGTTTANYIGKSQYAADPYFKGLVDDFRFYNYAMTSVEVKALMSSSTGINDVEINQTSFYPNPAKDVITVNNASDSRISIYSSVGNVVLEQTLINPGELVDISRLATGTYVVVISDNTGRKTRKVLMVK